MQGHRCSTRASDKAEEEERLRREAEEEEERMRAEAEEEERLKREAEEEEERLRQEALEEEEEMALDSWIIYTLRHDVQALRLRR